mmetsp:Transcript_168748/g.542324  ORF Transcript_168748/g.542324 Transcript_168748/m.542324 type:complete len:399 (+) Transcript_168748:457-1653(+)
MWRVLECRHGPRARRLPGCVSKRYGLRDKRRDKLPILQRGSPRPLGVAAHKDEQRRRLVRERAAGHQVVRGAPHSVQHGPGQLHIRHHALRQQLAVRGVPDQELPALGAAGDVGAVRRHHATHRVARTLQACELELDPHDTPLQGREAHHVVPREGKHPVVHSGQLKLAETSTVQKLLRHNLHGVDRHSLQEGRRVGAHERASDAAAAGLCGGVKAYLEQHDMTLRVRRVKVVRGGRLAREAHAEHVGWPLLSLRFRACTAQCRPQGGGRIHLPRRLLYDQGSLSVAHVVGDRMHIRRRSHPSALTRPELVLLPRHLAEHQPESMACTDQDQLLRVHRKHRVRTDGVHVPRKREACMRSQQRCAKCSGGMVLRDLVHLNRAVAAATDQQWMALRHSRS